MTEPKAYNENSPAFDVRTDVKREQWQLLLSNVRASTVPTALVGGLFAVFFSHFASAPHTQWWWAALLSVLAARWWLAAAGEGGLGLRRGPDWCLHLSLFASGLLWGAAPLLVLHHADDTLLFTAVLLAAGVALHGTSDAEWQEALMGDELFDLLAVQRSHPTELIGRHAGEVLQRGGHAAEAQRWFTLSVQVAAAGGPALQRTAVFTNLLAQHGAQAATGPRGCLTNPCYAQR